MTLDLAESTPAQVSDGGPAAGTEELMSEMLAEVVGVERVSVNSHFFDELGADSMLMAQFCARVRKREGLPSVSIKEVYRHPTIRSLAASLVDGAATPVEAPPEADTTIAHEPPVEPPTERPPTAGTARYLLCGALQLLAFVAYLCVAAAVLARGYEWISAGSGPIDVYLRSVLVGGAIFIGACSVPIVAKWILIGRWRRQEIRIWSLAYVRFWIVKTLVRTNPLVLFVGSPVYSLYLRALGARVGRSVLILSRHVPVCTDLLTIGDGTVIRKDSFFTCYRAERGVIETGPVSLGRDAVVGDASVIDIDASMGDGAQLAHASSLHRGQAVPAGERVHGSPALERTDVDYRAVERAQCSTVRRAAYGTLQVLTTLALRVPLAIGAPALLIAALPQLSALFSSEGAALTNGTFFGNALVASFAMLFGALAVGLVLVGTVPRALNLAIKSDRTYRLYGFRYGAHRAIERLTNVPFFPRLLGDSSYIVPYLRWLGYDLSHVVQTGSNFGLEVKHENPYLSTIGSGTMVADGLSIVNTEFSDTSFRASQATIGPHNYLGNYITYPARGRTGDDCLLATKAMVPLDGETRERTGLLGSPSFEIPRSVQRDKRFDHLARGDELRRRLAAKNRHNAVTIGLYLVVWWTFLFGATVLSGLAVSLHDSVGASAFALAGVLALAFRIAHFSLVERLATGFRDLQPRYCSIYDPYFWWHERFWKLATQPLILDGTPFKSLTWRLLGVRIGRRVFDDGCAIVEKTLTTIGDESTLNVRSVIQAHSQEDGTFKSDRIAIGAGCTLGIGALVHYGATMGDGAVLAPDSFLMKGEEVPPGARWGGNPARELRAEGSASDGTHPDESYLTAASSPSQMGRQPCEA
jgi:non-ribosomal peptide synthetase-like protein